VKGNMTLWLLGAVVVGGVYWYTTQGKAKPPPKPVKPEPRFHAGPHGGGRGRISEAELVAIDPGPARVRWREEFVREGLVNVEPEAEPEAEPEPVNAPGVFPPHVPAGASSGLARIGNVWQQGDTEDDGADGLFGKKRRAKARQMKREKELGIKDDDSADGMAIIGTANAGSPIRAAASFMERVQSGDLYRYATGAEGPTPTAVIYVDPNTGQDQRFEAVRVRVRTTANPRAANILRLVAAGAANEAGVGYEMRSAGPGLVDALFLSTEPT